MLVRLGTGGHGLMISYVLVLSCERAFDIAQRRVCLNDATRHQVIQLKQVSRGLLF